MSPRDDSPPDPSTAGCDQLQHDLLSPLTIISGRAQILARMARRSSSVTEGERAALLEGLAIFQEAVRVEAAHIEALRRENRDARVHDGMAVPGREDASE